MPDFVKQLVWEAYPGDGRTARHGYVGGPQYLERAVTPFASYFTLVSDNRFSVYSDYTDDTEYETVEAAKAAAQADYEVRILAALEPQEAEPAGWQRRSRHIAEKSWGEWEHHSDSDLVDRPEFTDDGRTINEYRALFVGTVPASEKAAGAEAIARVISLSYGEKPDDNAPLSKICGPNNEPLPNWMAYEEQAKAILSWAGSVARAPVTDEELAQWAEKRADDAGRLARELIGFRRLASSDPVQGWQTMDSAPKDGTEILLRIPCKGWPETYRQVGHWASDLSGSEQPPFQGWFCGTGHGFAQCRQPTGWMPLPAAPLAAKPEGE